MDLGFVGLAGVGGTIAFIVLAPAIAIPLLQAVAGFVIRCKPCLIVIAILSAAIAGNIHGKRKADARCHASELAAELRNHKADLAAARKSAADETERANTIEANADEQQKKDRAAIAALKQRPPTCAFDDIDAGRVPDDKPGPGHARPAAKTR